MLNSMVGNGSSSSNSKERELDIYSMVKKTLWSTVLGAAFVVAHRGKSGKISSFLQAESDDRGVRFPFYFLIFLGVCFAGQPHRENILSTCIWIMCQSFFSFLPFASFAAVIGSMRNRCEREVGSNEAPGLPFKGVMRSEARPVPHRAILGHPEAQRWPKKFLCIVYKSLHSS